MNHFPFKSQQHKEEYLNYYQSQLIHWPKPYEEIKIKTSFGITNVRINGDRNAPPLLLFHGAGTCSLQWLLNIETLSKHFRTYAIDGLIHLGCLGKSAPDKPIRNEHDAAKWIDGLLKGLGITAPIHILGSSYGGWLASHYAKQRQESIDKIVLVAPAGSILPLNKRYQFRSMLMHIFSFEFFRNRYFKWVFKNVFNQNHELFSSVIQDFDISSRSFIPINPKVLPKAEPLNNQEIKTLDIPTKIILAEDDVIYSSREAESRIKTLNEKIEVQTLDGAGHDLLLTHTDFINQLVVDFLLDCQR
ncbi:carboxylesterase YbfK [Vibrio nigripulchritudo]|uniref:alpha/beta fold hydrolase n=1 Tax=Vibrio nigripulchritudo TaxID=28173 RepID=UPI00190D0ED2|nr:alpha/beta hydrolase [Vibrio nigripulchritudo]BCL69575.1 carboxylesterase YbfK [Vibrio nigripulchritudo]BDU30918.1 carboxylesterase YbfK [Vibrio nigripulchritudo]